MWNRWHWTGRCNVVISDLFLISSVWLFLLAIHNGEAKRLHIYYFRLCKFLKDLIFDMNSLVDKCVNVKVKVSMASWHLKMSILSWPFPILSKSLHPATSDVFNSDLEYLFPIFRYNFLSKTYYQLYISINMCIPKIHKSKMKGRPTWFTWEGSKWCFYPPEQLQLRNVSHLNNELEPTGASFHTRCHW